MRSNLHDIEVHLHHETEKAWLVSTDGYRENAQWIPKSAAEMQQKVSRIYILTAPEPLLIEKGLV